MVKLGLLTMFGTWAGKAARHGTHDRVKFDRLWNPIWYHVLSRSVPANIVWKQGF